MENLGLVLQTARSMVLDGWENSTTGMGTTAFDKTTGARFVRQAAFSPQYLSDLFNGDALARRMCELENKEMLRKGFEVTPGNEQDAEIATELMTALKNLGAAHECGAALTWEDVFGGAVVMLGIDDGTTDPMLPVNEGNIRAITSVKALEGSRMHARSWYPATSPRAGHVEVWGIEPYGGPGPRGASGVTYVHESRLLVFPGGLCTTDQRIANNGWGTSTLAAVHDPLMDFNMSWRGVTHMLQSANQDVWYFGRLKNALEGTTAAMQEYFRGRFQLAQMRMGPNRAITLDAEGERFERHGSQFTGVPDTIEQQALRLAAARGWPVTILLGRSPAGMNATGESDMDVWYNLVDSDRKQRLEPRLERLVRLLMLSKEGPTKGVELEGWRLVFPALHQLSDLEQAELRGKQAATDVAYINSGVVRPEEIAVSRFRPDGWSAETVIDLDVRNAALESDDENAEPPSDKGTVGAQTSAIASLVKEVATGQMPRETAVNILATVFGLEVADADKLLGDVGKGFVPAPLVLPAPAAPAPADGNA